MKNQQHRHLRRWYPRNSTCDLSGHLCARLTSLRKMQPKFCLDDTDECGEPQMPCNGHVHPGFRLEPNVAFRLWRPLEVGGRASNPRVFHVNVPGEFIMPTPANWTWVGIAFIYLGAPFIN